jgi:hypothetical protein
MDEIRAEVGPAVWDEAEKQARQDQDLQQGVKRKNPLLVAATVERLFLNGVEIPRLNRLGEALLKHAETVCQ